MIRTRNYVFFFYIMEAALELDETMGLRFEEKEYIFSDLDCSPKILKLMRFRMHFLPIKTHLLKSSLIKSG